MNRCHNLINFYKKYKPDKSANLWWSVIITRESQVCVESGIHVVRLANFEAVLSCSVSRPCCRWKYSFNLSDTVDWVIPQLGLIFHLKSTWRRSKWGEWMSAFQFGTPVEVWDRSGICAFSIQSCTLFSNIYFIMLHPYIMIESKWWDSGSRAQTIKIYISYIKSSEAGTIL